MAQHTLSSRQAELAGELAAAELVDVVVAVSDMEESVEVSRLARLQRKQTVGIPATSTAGTGSERLRGGQCQVRSASEMYTVRWAVGASCKVEWISGSDSSAIVRVAIIYDTLNSSPPQGLHRGKYNILALILECRQGGRKDGGEMAKNEKENMGR